MKTLQQEQEQEQVASLPAHLKALMVYWDEGEICQVAHRADITMRFPVFVTHR